MFNKFKKNESKLYQKERKLAFFLLLPTIFIVLSIVIFPLLANFWISFKPISLGDLRPPKLIIKESLRGKLINKTFLITGKLDGMSRAEAKSLIEKNSGKILSSISNKLNYLIIGENTTPKKVSLAKELNIKIIYQKEFEKILN